MNAIQIQFIAGITNLIFFLLIAFSCRCLGMHKLTKNLFQNETYMKFYKYHCYFWYALFISILVHVTLAFYLFGIPFN